jgi:putative peptidoglycan lipid II flippase
VEVLFHYGKFTAQDVAMTVLALRGYGVGLLGIVAIKVLAPAYFAKGDVKTPVRIAIGVLVLTQLMNLVLVPWLGHAGLALSIGLAALVNAGFLFFGLRRRGTYQPAPGWLGFAWKLLRANALLAAALAWAATKVDWVALQAHTAQRVGGVAAVLFGVAVLYFVALALCGVRPADFKRRA